MKLEINNIDKIRMLLDCIYCMTNHIAEYPQYNFNHIQQMAEMAQEIENQVNNKISSVQAALHPSNETVPVSHDKPYKGFGDK